jgi:hypothetical protein
MGVCQHVFAKDDAAFEAMHTYGMGEHLDEARMKCS